MSLEELEEPAPGWAIPLLCQCSWLSVLFQAPGHLPSTSQTRGLKGEPSLLWLNLQLGRELDWRNLWEVRALAQPVGFLECGEGHAHPKSGPHPSHGTSDFFKGVSSGVKEA